VKEESAKKIMKMAIMHCTLFNYSEETETFIGYNFDWFGKNGKIWFMPSDNDRYGYCLTSRFGRLFPYDGMNQWGLYMGQTAVPVIKNKRKGLKKWSISTYIINRILGNCRNVDEACTLLKSYHIIFGTLLGLVMFHFMVADASGESVILEYIGNEMKQLKKNDTYQVMTNFYISDRDIQWPDPVQGCGGYDRYEILENALKGRKTVGVDDVYSMLKRVCLDDWEYDGHVYNTLFSNVYKLKTKEIFLAYNKNYDRIFSFRLDEELKKGVHFYKIQDLELKGIS